MRLGDSRSLPLVSPEQLHGIEIKPYAYELAQATIWIGYIQWLRENGYGRPAEPIRKTLQAIRRMDAILVLGDKKMRSQLGDKYVDDLRRLYAGRVPGGAELVTYWFEKARAMIGASKAKRAGLLATNSIRQQGNRVVLSRIKESGDIFMAWGDRPWILDGAALRVSLVGFDGGVEGDRCLDGRSVATINADLTPTTDVTAARVLRENEGLCFLGMMKAGPFDLDDATAERMLQAPVNLNGRYNTEIVKHRLILFGRPTRSPGKLNRQAKHAPFATLNWGGLRAR